MEPAVRPAAFDSSGRSCRIRGGRAVGSRDRPSPAAGGGAVGVLEVTGREPAILSTVASRAREPTEPDWHNATNSANAAVSGAGHLRVRLRGVGEHRSSYPAPGRITSPQRGSVSPPPM